LFYLKKCTEKLEEMGIKKAALKLFIILTTNGLGLWCLTRLTIIFQLYRGGQFYWWRKPEYQEKTTDLTNFNT